MLRSGLNLYAYQPGSAFAARTAYGDQLEELTFTTIAPGGWGDLTCKLRLPDARLVPPELRIFQNIALMDGPQSIFQGRWDEPGIALDARDGDLLNLTAQGGASCLKDDPDDASYDNQSSYQILSAEVQRRANYLPLDQDLSFAKQSPKFLYSPGFNGKDLEEVINELQAMVGDYMWGVWDHPHNRDPQGFPTWTLFWHGRDTTSISYIATLEDENAYDVRPTIEYSFNVVTVIYNDSLNNNKPSVYTLKDARLAANGSQGTAPFPWRRKRLDLSSYSLSSNAVQVIAQQLLSSYQNGGYKISLDLTSVSDASGQPIPLHLVRADQNIFIPHLTPYGATLVTTPTVNANLFYITETSYKEAAGQAPVLTLTCNNFQDASAYQVARLQAAAERQTKNGKLSGVIQSTGVSETGYTATGWGPEGVGGSVHEHGTNFKTIMSNVPTSISFAVLHSSNESNVAAADITVNGFSLQVTIAANGAGYWRGHYSTAGNCLTAIDEARGTFDHHCDTCERAGGLATRRGLRLGTDLRANTRDGLATAPGASALSIRCAGCGTTECFNTGLTSADEAPNEVGQVTWRARQAQLIRQAMRHPALGLATSEPECGMAQRGARRS